jgi:hypothetical protein
MISQGNLIWHKGILPGVLGPLYLILSLSAGVFSQNSAILDEFSASENEGTVYLYWIITSGSTCDGIKIFRSNDSLNFIQIGEIGGVCGSSTAPQPYSFVDEFPETNGINYYRLELGYTGYSETIFLEMIDFKDDGYQVRPNPVVDKACVFFENATGNTFTFELYNLQGQQTGSMVSKENFFEVSTMHLSNGMYVFIIYSRDHEVIITGKLYVLH